MLMPCGAHWIEVKPRRNCKRFILRYLPADKRLALSVPCGASVRDVEKFLADHADWIASHAAVTAYTPSFSLGERHLLLGRYVVLGRDVPADERVLQALRDKELLALVNELLPRWSLRMDVHPTAVRLRTVKSRWGSCNVATGAIMLSRKLALVPPPLVESVLVHELCHLRHPDHSPAFHRDLLFFLPDAQERKRQLNAFVFDALPPEGD